ncbi:unnamed protein product [Chrysoparadoxa australica]
MMLSLFVFALVAFLIVCSSTICSASTQTAVITGSAGGLGKALAGHFASLSCNVVVTARDSVRAEAVAACIGTAHTHPFALDVTDAKSIDTFKRRCCSQLAAGGDDHLMLFNNAGVCIEGQGREVFERTMAVNFWGALAVTKAVLPSMLAAGKGSVVCVSSGDGELACLSSALQRELKQAENTEAVKAVVQHAVDLAGVAGVEHAFGATPAYSVSKAALNAVVRLEGEVLMQQNVALTAVCPGDVATAMCSNPQAAISPELAAKEVAMIGLHPKKFMGGLFYREREVIPW